MDAKIFRVEDRILSKLQLPNPCPIRIEIERGYVYLYIGPRDFQWKDADCSLVGCGTSLGSVEV